MTSKPILRAVIFDLDGTLVSCPYDFAGMRQAVLDVARLFGLPVEKLTGMGVLEAISEGESLLGRHRGEEFKAEADKAVLSFELSGAESCFPLEGAKQLLEWLHLKDVRTGIITRNSISVVGKLLQEAGFCYDALLAREAVPRVKPHPDHIFAMLEKLGASPKETLMVGDHIWDMAGGKSAGLQCVGVTTGTSTKEELSSAGANIVLDDITQLSGWLMENFSLSER